MSFDVHEKVPNRELWHTATLDTPEDLPLKWSEVSQGTPDAVVIQEVIRSGREVGLAVSSDNTSRLWVAADSPARTNFQLLLPCKKFTFPTRFDRLFIMRDTANASDATKTYHLEVGPRPGSLDYSTTPTPTIVDIVKVQGVAAHGSAATGNPVLVAGSDGANAKTILVDTAGRVLTVDKSHAFALGVDTVTRIAPVASNGATLVVLVAASGALVVYAATLVVSNTSATDYTVTITSDANEIMKFFLPSKATFVFDGRGDVKTNAGEGLKFKLDAAGAGVIVSGAAVQK